MMKTERIKFSELSHFTPKQKEASSLLNKYKYVLYGGAMGGGKSYWLRWQLVKLLVKWAKGGYKNVVVGLFCEDYPALKDRHLSKIGIEFPTWLGVFHADHKQYGKAFILNPEYGSGVLVFRNLDDPSKYQSAEFACIAIDEITKNPEETFEDLRTRLRWAGIEDVKFIAATNPGGIGHGWVKKKFIDGIHEETEQEGHLFKYIQALATDNPHLSEQYLISLEGLSPEKRRAFLEGDWDIFKGQYFTEWRKQIHVIPPHQIKDYNKNFVCGDYGYAKPSAVYWCSVDSDGVITVYRELYITSHTYEQLAEKIVSMTPHNEQIDYWVFDPAIWAKKGETEMSGAELMQNKYQELMGRGIHLIKGNNDRINGWNLVREYLKPFIRNGEQIAKLQVFNICENLIRTLPGLIYDAHRVEDLDSDGEDHSADAIRYGIMSRPQAPDITATNPLARLLNKPFNQDLKTTNYE